MIHDQDLLDRLAGFRSITFEGPLYRATGLSTDPTMPSVNGGRWSVPPRSLDGRAALYTSVEANGAIAEVVSFLAGLTPPPSERPIKVSTLAVSLREMVTIERSDFVALGIDESDYGTRDYARTQQIGSALAFLGRDGLLAPSARWACSNVVIFPDNHSMDDDLEVIGTDEVLWREWAKKHGLL